MFSKTAKKLYYNSVSKYYFTKIIDISKKRIDTKLNKFNDNINNNQDKLVNNFIKRGWYYR